MTHDHRIDRPAHFVDRHIGPSDEDISEMLEYLGADSLEDLVYETIPDAIRTPDPLRLDPPRPEFEAVEDFRRLMSQNETARSFIGMGYYDCVVPPVIQRNVLENPGWYTQYTPYQAEIAQGRLEALFVFQTAVADLTGLPIANSSLLDEATAAAEGMSMVVRGNRRNKSTRFLVSNDCHPQTIEVVQTRAEPLGIDVEVVDVADFESSDDVAGILLQYPTSDGRIEDYRQIVDRIHDANGRVVVAADLLALTLLKPPGEWGADVVVGSSQRFGVPLGFGGPHAAYMSTTEEFKRHIPGRLVGLSVDAQGNEALRLALQTREQHIRRERATSNICTAQVLLAVMAGMYAVYHGPRGLREIAERVRRLTYVVRRGLRELGFDAGAGEVFDTLRVDVGDRYDAIVAAADEIGVNLRHYGGSTLGVSLDEATTTPELQLLFQVFNQGEEVEFSLAELDVELPEFSEEFKRETDYLTHPVFHSHRSETEFLRWVTTLQSRDLSLTHSMIPLGSCTMKLNATSEMMPVTWDTVGGLHPFAPPDQTAGYRQMFRRLEAWLAEITGMQAVSLQPNAGSQGEYAGMLVISAYHASRGESHRDVCLIPESAHGTNPASAVMAGMNVVVVKCDENGNIDVDDLQKKVDQNAEKLAAIMITYPSTHGVFETRVKEICEIVHAGGGQVYLDGANMNAQVGLCRPGEYGADVCHLNLHKTFCIPHGGGGPGMGPIAVREHLADFLPGHPLVTTGGEKGVGAISAAPWGSPSILPISYLYIHMLGAEGLTRASEVAILNANYMAKKLSEHYPVLYTGERGRVAHEFILDLRDFKKTAGVEVADVAKRLMDYGFHAPTISWPVLGTMMIEPTESESRPELDRFCDALISIREEIAKIENGDWDREDNPLKNAPHTADVIAGDEWPHGYPRSIAAFPLDYVRTHKFWPAVGRIDDAYGDRHLVCACPPVSEYEE
jgi:glycine dehydrogenase